MNPVLLVGALLGFLSVVIGALSEHLLQHQVSAEVWRWVMTAVRYHQIGAVIITAIGLALSAKPQAVEKLARAAWVLSGGTVLFSFSIYAAAASGLEALTYITPVGGITLMLGWGLLAYAAWFPSDR